MKNVFSAGSVYRFFLLLTFFASNFAFAGHEFGNGGGVVVCRRPILKTIKSVEVLDLYEARTQRKLTSNFGDTQKPWREQVEFILNRIRPHTEFRYQLYSGWLSAFEDEALFLKKTNFTTVPDSYFVALPKDCAYEQAVVQREPLFTGDPRYFVNQDLWDHMNETQRAALVLHELVYREAIGYGHNNSVRTRYIVGYFTSNKKLLDYEFGRAIQEAHFEVNDRPVDPIFRFVHKVSLPQIWQSAADAPCPNRIILENRALVSLGECSENGCDEFKEKPLSVGIYECESETASEFCRFSSGISHRLAHSFDLAGKSFASFRNSYIDGHSNIDIGKSLLHFSEEAFSVNPGDGVIDSKESESFLRHLIDFEFTDDRYSYLEYVPKFDRWTYAGYQLAHALFYFSLGKHEDPKNWTMCNLMFEEEHGKLTYLQDRSDWRAHCDLNIKIQDWYFDFRNRFNPEKRKFQKHPNLDQLWISERGPYKLMLNANRMTVYVWSGSTAPSDEGPSEPILNDDACVDPVFNSDQSQVTGLKVSCPAVYWSDNHSGKYVAQHRLPLLNGSYELYANGQIKSVVLAEDYKFVPDPETHPDAEEVVYKKGTTLKFKENGYPED